jgi:serine/threonine-protein kinase RsbW
MLVSFDRTLDALPGLLRTVSEFYRTNGATEHVVHLLSFAVEELFTNMVKYNPSGPPTVELSLDHQNGRAVITMRDEQDSDFSIMDAPEPAFDRPIEERAPGGLGLYLVKKMIESVQVSRVAKKNTIIMSHPLEQS